MKKLFSSIWFLALLIAVPFVLLLPPLFEKYKLEEVTRSSNFSMFKNSKVYYADLNGDGEKERIESGEIDFREKKRHAVQIHDNLPAVQFYEEYERATSKLFFDDTNNNGFDEIFGFSFSGDSLFLNHSEPFNLNSGYDRFFAQKFLVPFVDEKEGYKAKIRIDKAFFEDLNDDGSNEFIFSLKFYGEINKMSIIAFDPANNTFTSSEIIGDRNLNIRGFDFDQDGKNEILADGQSMGNARDSSLNLADGYPYLKLYKQDLELVSAVRFPLGSIKTIPVNQKDDWIFYTFYNKRSIENPVSIIYKTNKKGEFLDSVNLAVENQVNQPWMCYNEDKTFWVYTEKGFITQVDEDLKVLKSITFGAFGNDLIFADPADINHDGVSDFVAYNYKSAESVLFTDGFKQKYEIGDSFISLVTDRFVLKENQFFAHDEKETFIFSFQKNPYRLLAFPLYLLIYCISLLIVILIRKSQEAVLREKLELKNKVHDLQLKVLKNQLDPHFVFNTFNTIAAVLKQGDREEAYDLFVLLSKVVRKNLSESDNVYTSLNKEILFVKDYLEIQKFRFKNIFEFNVEMDESVKMEVTIPRMLVLIHVENALKHGLLKRKGGVLNVSSTSEEEIIRIEIEDNGIGRDHHKTNPSENSGIIGGNNGIGLKTIQKMIDLNNTKANNKITQEIIDLKDKNGKACGTKVVIHIIPVISKTFGER